MESRVDTLNFKPDALGACVFTASAPNFPPVEGISGKIWEVM